MTSNALEFEYNEMESSKFSLERINPKWHPHSQLLDIRFLKINKF